MQSQEFIPEQELSEYSETDVGIRRALEKKGYKFLGAGVDQSAYLEPGTGFVLKVFGSDKSNQFSPDHMMFVKWAKFCEKHKDNPYLPKFYGYDSFMFKGKRYLQIRQESLRDIDNSTGELLETAADAIELDDTDFDTFVNLLPIEYGKSIVAAYEKLVQKIGINDVHRLYTTMEKLLKIGNKQGWTFDLHKHNFMQRADGTPVIVDPWVLPES